MEAATATSRRSAIDEAWALIHQLAMSQRARTLAIAAEFDLAPAQLFALKALDPDEPVPMGELAQALCCDNSNVTGIIDRLEDRGLVERRPGTHDRRVKMLVVTEAGADVRARIKQRLEQAPESLRALSSAEQTQLRDLMRRALGR